MQTDAMNDERESEAASYLANLPEYIKKAEDIARSGCGLSYELYEARVQGAYGAILEKAPASVKVKVEAALRDRGYDPLFTPYEPSPGECDLTGIDINCCPCGRHP